MAWQLWPQGWLELAFLYADGEPIATLCCFAYGSTYAAYNSGYHPAYAELSAGIVLLLNASVWPLRGASRLLTSCVAMSPTNIVLARRISRSTNCSPALPARCRGRVYEWRTSHQPVAAPGRHVQRA